ncbi:MAG: hypothetical protein CMB47_02375 [Euryarchaeota archaeon]|nr:hypothetical protein [Euryarchaeota archaeon]|tara:strand:- start:1828 stop:2418 length:591 start_codon:yes stop_codon:yes gene_type:complete
MITRTIFLTLIFLTSFLAGCITENQSMVEEEIIEPSAPERMSFTSRVMGDENNSDLDLHDYASNNSVLLIWVAANCKGCHDWTDVLAEEVNNGNISNDSILSIHRYPAFESPSSVENVYGKNSTNPVSWPLLLPSEDTQVYDLDTGLESEYSIYDAFGNPSTPTLQIIDSTGKLTWSSKTYWATEELVDEIKVLLE